MTLQFKLFFEIKSFSKDICFFNNNLKYVLNKLI